MTPPPPPPVNKALLQRAYLEAEIAACIRECMTALDGFVVLAHSMDVSGMTNPTKHQLDTVGGLDGCRVSFRGQCQHIDQIAPRELAPLTDRHRSAVRVIREHLVRSAALGQWLTEKTAPAAAEEFTHFLTALHLVMQPRFTTRQRFEVLAQYMKGLMPRDPQDV